MQATQCRAGEAKGQTGCGPTGEKTESGAGGSNHRRETTRRGKEAKEVRGGHGGQSRGAGRSVQVGERLDIKKQPRYSGQVQKLTGSLSCCFTRGECTDTLRRRITELEAECKKLTMDIKVKEDQIRELELKVQVGPSSLSTLGVLNTSRLCTVGEVWRTCGIYSALFVRLSLSFLCDRSFINIRKMKKTQRC